MMLLHMYQVFSSEPGKREERERKRGEGNREGRGREREKREGRGIERGGEI